MAGLFQTLPELQEGFLKQHPSVLIELDLKGFFLETDLVSDFTHLTKQFCTYSVIFFQFVQNCKMR